MTFTTDYFNDFFDLATSFFVHLIAAEIMWSLIKFCIQIINLIMIFFKSWCNIFTVSIVWILNKWWHQTKFLKLWMIIESLMRSESFRCVSIIWQIYSWVCDFYVLIRSFLSSSDIKHIEQWWFFFYFCDQDLFWIINYDWRNNWIASLSLIICA